jgi:hypothetical protein
LAVLVTFPAKEHSTALAVFGFPPFALGIEVNVLLGTERAIDRPVRAFEDDIDLIGEDSMAIVMLACLAILERDKRRLRA